MDFSEVFTLTSFEFDGNNDYITVNCDSDVGKSSIKENGLTFEFYGKLFNDGTAWLPSNSKIDEKEGFRGLFCYWCGDEMQQAKFRFGFYNSYNAFSWSLVLNNKGKDLSRWFGPQSRDSETPWNQTSAKGSVKYNEDIYLVIIIDPNNKSQKSGEIFDGTEFSSKDCIKQDIYLNDDKLIDGWLNKDLWDTSLVENLDTLNKFCLGRCSMSRSGEWCYSHMSAYSLRFYNRALTDDEINANREKTIEYHKILESQNSEKAE